MSQKTIYFVCGGVFADGNLDRLEPGATPECYGPFTDLATAESVCAGQRRRNVDICWHHLYVVSTHTPG
jgi:hypothetical protein